MQTNDNLQMNAIRRTFDQLDKDQQEFLLRDLMRQAGVYVISRGVFSQDAYKCCFVEFFRSSWLKHTDTLKDDYIDECFKIWKIFERKSIGGQNGSIYYVGDWILTTCQDSINELIDVFKYHARKSHAFEYSILFESRAEIVQLAAQYPVDIRSSVRCEIHVTDLFKRLLISKDEAYMILVVFGYLDGEEREKYSKMLNEKYPGYDKLGKMLVGEKLESQLGINVIHD